MPKGGGCHFHKPGCKCDPCAARVRKEEALASGIGDGGSPVKTRKKVINADSDDDFPIIIAQGRSKRARIGEWLTLRATEPGISNNEVARRMGITAHTLNSIITKANREGWLKFDDPLSRIEYEIIPKTLDNINYWLDKKDKTVSLETAKATSYKVYQASKGALESPQTVLALKIETVPLESMKVVEGHVVGKPRELTE
jgi:transposase